MAEDVGVRPLACRDCSFESRREGGCCVLSDSGVCGGPILRPEESYLVCIVIRYNNNTYNEWAEQACHSVGMLPAESAEILQDRQWL